MSRRGSTRINVYHTDINIKYFDFLIDSIENAV